MADEETRCELCGRNLMEIPPQHAGDLPPWIDEGPHRTVRCDICRGRVPHDELDDHYKTVHSEWADWRQKQKTFVRFAKASIIVLILLVALGVATGDYLYLGVFLAFFMSVTGLFYDFYRNKLRYLHAKWTQKNA